MYNNKKTAVIIAAAGIGSRMGGSVPKQYLKIAGEPILLKTMRAFCSNQYVDYVFVVTNREYMDYCQRLTEDYQLKKTISIVEGGKERQDSVYYALQEVNRCRPGVEYVLVHDGARPFVSQETINFVITAAAGAGAAVACVPVKNSIRQSQGTDSRNIERKNLYAVQTPQGFKKSILMEAYEKAFADGYYGTDDAGLVERIGQPVELVRGQYDNIKITTKEDMPMESRAGTGFDVHELVENRSLILGGVEIPFEKGLLGHSDADVLLHALMDALLGAAAMGDIGQHFPDTEEAFRGASSLELLGKVKQMLDQEFYRIGNVDITVIAEKPKIKSYIGDMKRNMAKVLEIEEDRINIKGTTTEKLGFTGRGEGIAAQAVCLIYR